MLGMLDAARITLCELFQAWDGRDIRHGIVTGSYHECVELFSPPVVRLTTIVVFSTSKRENPFLAARPLDRPFDCSVVLNKSSMALFREKVLDILPDDRMMPERRILAVALN